MLSALVLDPDPWRFRGICSYLEESERIEVVGTPDFAGILILESAPADLRPDAILISHRIIIEYGISLVAHLRAIFRAAVLVYGEEPSLEVTAQMLLAGASGYFQMNSPPSYLIKAVTLVVEGKLWGPRDALAMMAKHAQQASLGSARFAESLSHDELKLLGFLNDGYSNREIAVQLGVAEVTVKMRLTKLYRRFDVTGRLQLLSKAIRAGLVDASVHGPGKEPRRTAAPSPSQWKS